MSRNSQGVLARKLVKSPCRPGVCLRLRRRPASPAFLQGVQAVVVAAVLDDDLEAAGRAQAFDRRGAEDVDEAVVDLRLESPSAGWRRSPSPESPAAVRLWKSSSITYMAPKFGALALSRIDCPAMATVWLTPGCRLIRAISSMLLHDASVRSDEAASGSCTLTSR